jgi:repressor LexA
MIGLTQRQTELLTFISAYSAEHDGVPPSYQEMSDAMGVGSKGRVWEMIKSLEERGHLRRLSGRARAIEVVEPSERVVTISPSLWPILERYAASHHIPVARAACQLIRDQLESA